MGLLKVSNFPWVFDAASGAALILANSVFAKFFVTSCRVRLLNNTMTEEQMQTWRKTQMNDAEYAPLFIGILLFCAAQNIECNAAATLATIGSVGYLAVRWTIGDVQLGNGPPVYAIFGSQRYISLILLTSTLLKWAAGW